MPALLPPLNAPRERGDRGVAEGSKGLRREEGADSAATVKEEGGRPIRQRGLGPELEESSRERESAGDPLPPVLLLLPDIDEDDAGLGEPVTRLPGLHLGDQLAESREARLERFRAGHRDLPP